MRRARIASVFRVSAAMCAILAILTGRAARGYEIVYGSTGFIQQTDPTFGLPEPTGGFSGRVVYASEGYAEVPISGCDCNVYRQATTNGFQADFGGIRVRADDYILELSNDLPQGAAGIADVATFAFGSDFHPPLDRPLIVNEVPRLEGQLFLSFFWYGGRKFESPVISALGDLTDYDFAVSMLGDSGSQDAADVFAVIEGLSRVLDSPADFDGNLSVDGADFLLWQRTLGSTVNLQADANNNGLVDSEDLQAWKNDFGLKFIAPAALAVPEPASCAIAAWILILVFGIRGSDSLIL